MKYRLGNIVFKETIEEEALKDIVKEVDEDIERRRKNGLESPEKYDEHY